MPPAERPLPCYAAEPPQEPLPYGRWGEALGEHFRVAAAGIETDEELGEPGDITWFPDRTWGGRTYVPATAPTSEGFELFGFVSYTREHEGAQAADFSARRRLHRRDRRGQPGLDARPLRPGDRPLARPRRPPRRDHPRVGRVAGGQRRGGHRRARPHHHRPVRAGDDRFTLVSLDDYTGDYVEVRLFAQRGAELARESLYEDED